MCKALFWAYCMSLVCRFTSNCWMYFLATSSPWRALKNTFFFNKLFSPSPQVRWCCMTWFTLFYLIYIDFGIQDTHSSNSMPDGFRAPQLPFSCSFSTSLLTPMYSPFDEKPHLLKAVLYGGWCYLSQASALKWRAVRSSIFILDISPSHSSSVSVFCMSCFLYWHLRAWMIPISIGCKWLVQSGGEKIEM